MYTFRLSSGHSFDWDGAFFHHDHDRTPPSIPEVEELAWRLHHELPSDVPALMVYLQKHFGQSDMTRLRDAQHALQWITSGEGSYFRRIYARDLRAILNRGEMRCVWCGQWLPTKDQWFCPNVCEDGFRLRCDPMYIKQMVHERDNGICALCGKSDPRWEMDHIIPVSQGGGLCELSNYQTLCGSCHHQKTQNQRHGGDTIPIAPRSILALSDSLPDRLWELADYIRTLPRRDATLADNLRSAARRLRLAVESSAFDEAEHAAFRVAFFQRFESHRGLRDDSELNERMVIREEAPLDGQIAAWGEANWWLRGGPHWKIDIWDTFEDDCEFVASLVGAEAAKHTPVWQMTRGHYQAHCKAQGRTDIVENNRVYHRELKAAIEAGEPVPERVRTEYDYVVKRIGAMNAQGGRG